MTDIVDDLMGDYGFTIPKPAYKKLKAEIESLRQQLKAQQDAANHWFTEANKDHNRCVKLEQQLGECQAQERMLRDLCLANPECVTEEWLNKFYPSDSTAALDTLLKPLEQEIERRDQQLAECQAREYDFRETLAICLMEMDVSFKTRQRIKQALALPSDSTALDAMLKQAKSEELRPVYDFVGRDYAHLEPKEALEAWLSDVIRQEKRNALLEAADEFEQDSNEWISRVATGAKLRKKAKELE